MAMLFLEVQSRRVISLNDMIEIFKNQGKQDLSLGTYSIHDAADFLDIRTDHLIRILTQGGGQCQYGQYFLKLVHPL